MRPFTQYSHETRSVIVCHLLHVSLIHKFRRVRTQPQFPICNLLSVFAFWFFHLQCFWCIVCHYPLSHLVLLFRAHFLYDHLTFQPDCWVRPVVDSHILHAFHLSLSLSQPLCLPLRYKQYFTTHHSCVSIATFPIKSMSQQMSFNFYLLCCNDICCLFYSRSTAFAITTLFSVSKKSY